MTLAMMVMMICLSPKLQTALARVLDELGPKRKHALVKICSEQLRKVEKNQTVWSQQSSKKIKKKATF